MDVSPQILAVRLRNFRETEERAVVDEIVDARLPRRSVDYGHIAADHGHHILLRRSIQFQRPRAIHANHNRIRELKAFVNHKMQNRRHEDPNHPVSPRPDLLSLSTTRQLFPADVEDAPVVRPSEFKILQKVMHGIPAVLPRLELHPSAQRLDIRDAPPQIGIRRVASDLPPFGHLAAEIADQHPEGVDVRRGQEGRPLRIQLLGRAVARRPGHRPSSRRIHRQ